MLNRHSIQYFWHVCVLPFVQICHFFSRNREIKGEREYMQSEVFIQFFFVGSASLHRKSCARSMLNIIVIICVNLSVECALSFIYIGYMVKVLFVCIRVIGSTLYALNKLQNMYVYHLNLADLHELILYFVNHL